jgi:hypothetical protein
MTKDKDLGAGLIHPIARPTAETLPRPNGRYHENLEVALVALIAVCRNSWMSPTMQRAIYVAESVLMHGHPPTSAGEK